MVCSYSEKVSRLSESFDTAGEDKVTKEIHERVIGGKEIHGEDMGLAQTGE